uniref:T9SS type A sorting domain-containing protein n=1 Tax=Flavobacterium sp. TaxID=239 RepID=UPI00404B8B49
MPNPSATYQIAFEGINNFGRANVVDNVIIEETPLCPEPTGLSVNNITDTTADFSWTATTGNYEYVLDTNAADPAGAGTPISGETYNATLLTPETTYYFHVRSDCGSTWTTVSFTTLATPPSNNDCVNAIAVDCGDVVTGSTANGATDSGNNSSADVWYSYSGAAGDITVSLCNNTAYDSYLRVFDACGGTEIAFNDDFCGAQSQLTFTADGVTTYYIMVEGFSTNVGDFELAVTCVLSNGEFNANSFSAYPNPVKDVLNISYATEISSVTVINMIGQEVLSKNINATSSQVDMSQLRAGTYIV